MAATADGSARLALADARVSHLLVELIGLDVFESLGVVVSGDESIPVRCAAFDFTATDGNVRSNLFVIDTDDTNITADMTLDLGSERLAAFLKEHAAGKPENIAAGGKSARPATTVKSGSSSRKTPAIKAAPRKQSVPVRKAPPRTIAKSPPPRKSSSSSR